MKWNFLNLRYLFYRLVILLFFILGIYGYVNVNIWVKLNWVKIINVFIFKIDFFKFLIIVVIM